MRKAETHWAGFLIWNALPPAAFFMLFHTHGPKAAVLLAVLVGAANLLLHRYTSMRTSPFLLVASFFTVLFGGLDLVSRTPQFYRLEPFAQNLILGIVFWTTVFTRLPIAAWFAEGLPRSLRSDAVLADSDYLRKLTAIWGTYFLLKASVFLYLAFEVNLAELIVLRSLIGGSTLVLMVGGEILLRKIRFRRSLKLEAR